MKSHRKLLKKNSPLNELTVCLEVVTASCLNARKTLESLLQAIESESCQCKSDYVDLCVTTLNSIRRDVNSFCDYYGKVAPLHPEITEEPKVQELVRYITEQRNLIDKYFLQLPVREHVN